MFYAKDDGITHINIYSKGKTELGRFLTNFSYSPIETEDGHFDSVEGYWYWLSSKDDNLRVLSGWEAKEYGRHVGGNDWLDGELFKSKIKKAIDLKLKSNPIMEKNLFENILPLTHYYVYNNKKISVPKGKWIIEFLEDKRSINKIGY